MKEPVLSLEEQMNFKPHKKMTTYTKPSLTQQESIRANIAEDNNSWRSPNLMKPIVPNPTKN